MKSFFSLRYKFLILLSATCFAALALFSSMAIYVFKNDKISYIFDTSMNQSKTLARSLNSEFSSFLETLKTIAQSADLSQNKLSRSGEYLFSQKPNLLHVEVVLFDPVPKTLVQKSKNFDQKQLSLLRQKLSTLTESFHLDLINPADGLVALAVRGIDGQKRMIWSVAIFRSTELSGLVSQNHTGTFLVDRQTSRVFGGAEMPPALTTEVARWIAALRLPQATKLFNIKKENHLTSVSEVGIGGLYIVNSVRERTALAALYRLQHNSILFSIALLSVVLLISWASSRSLTTHLQVLSEAATAISKGNFNVKVDVKTSDEVGQLSHGFNVMASEVARLLTEMTDKGRMEAELKTAQTVQNTLFPKPLSAWSDFQIAGHYASASECGGDWWYYHRTGNKIFVWLGDATGHGAPAALITSAARAAASLVEWQPQINPAQAMRILNRAIYATSKGGMMMTFFIGCFDLEKKKFSYSNASHNPPFMISDPSKKESIERGDFEPLVEANNPRLGQNVDHPFTEEVIDLHEGDFLICFSDGITELKNPEGKDFGERRFLKSLAKALSEGQNLSDSIRITMDAADEHQQAEPLADDVTLVFCHFAPPKASAQAA